MENNEPSSQFDLLENLFVSGKKDELMEMLEEMPTIEVCDFLSSKEPENIVKFLKRLDIQIQGRIYSNFDIEMQIRLFHFLPRAEFAEIFDHMYSDIRADFYQELSPEEQTEFLPFLNKTTREDVIALSAYPPETAGGIMNTDFATIFIGMSVAQALEKIRMDAPSKNMIYYIYVVNSSMKLLGLVTLKDLVLSRPDMLIEDLLQEFFVYAEVNEDRESVAQKVEKYDLVAIPILNNFGQLVGIVSHDDVIDIIRAEQTEDMEKFMGIMPSDSEETYLGMTSFLHFRRRVGWLVGLAAIGIISGMIIHRYQAVLEELIILAIYMPMMAATGGNSGSQAATLIIRAMALGEINDSLWFKVVFKEIKISFLLSLCVAGLTFIKVAFFTGAKTVPDSYNLSYIAFIIAIAIALQVITSAIVGAGLPLIVKRMGGDPAVAASPAITTVVDITGLMIYFAVASTAMNF